ELKSVTLSNALTAINGYTFNNCSNLESIILPPAIKTIGTYAFSNCGSLKSIYMGPNVSSIQDQAFTNDFALTDIYITAQSAPTLGANSFPGSIFQNANLHLQGDNTWATAYKPRPNWSKFTESNVKVMPAATSMSTYNNINIFPDKPLTALAGQEAATRSLLLKAGKSAKYNTSLGADSGKTLEQTGIFWTSSDTDKIYIDNSGLITMKVIPTSPVTLEAISIYAGSPAIQITVGGGYSYVEGNNEPLYFSVLDEEAATCTVTAPENADLTTAVIPKKVIINDKEYTVTAVSDLAFFQCKSLTSVTIPNTITKLGYKAFCETALKQVTIPTSMTIISGDAFKATPLTSVVIPNSVTSIGSYAFNRCRQLETVTLGNGISIINGYTFFECSSLTSIVIPPSVKTVEACAFRNCVKLKTVYMGSKITKIGTQAFYGDEAITDIYITAAKAPSITDNSFATSVFENATLHLQGNGTESVYRTNSIWGNFKKAAVLLTPPTEMSTYNGINVFATSPLKAEAGKQPATTSLLLASGKTAKYYTSLTHDTGSLNETEILALSKVYWKTSSPANVYVDFNGNLTVVSAPVSPVKVTAETMYADSPVIEITVRGSYPVEGENLYFTILSEEDATCAVATTVNSGIETAVIPEKVTIKGKEYTVTAISDLAFYQCTKLTSVTIPNTVTKFGYKAFCQTGLEQVTIPASVTSIGGDAFKASKLTSVTIPNSVTAIGSWAFDRCANLKSVTLGNGITAIQGYTFSYCAALETIIIPPSVKAIESYAFRDCTALTAVYMGPNITRIATNAFGATPKLTDIYITAQNVPTLYESSFPSNVFENVTLHLQGADTEGNYRKNAVWNKFKKAAVVMPLPVSLSTVNGDDIHPTNPLTAEFGKTATHSFLLKPQGKVTYTTTLVAESQDTPLDVRNIFWKSTSADKVYVDFNGKITSNGILDAPVTITGESIYANGPVLQITITGCLLSDSSDGPLYYSVISEDMATCSVVASDEGILTVYI
ncbi:MAG: leucine-rich repeat domain-containing protein, partial [Muribaculaceae bacterium]|nr:leucine-rich repeat domain-containing protein [Muribaculaceae bacterium]